MCRHGGVSARDFGTASFALEAAHRCPPIWTLAMVSVPSHILNRNHGPPAQIAMPAAEVLEQAAAL